MPITIGSGNLPQPSSSNWLGGYGALGRMARRNYDPERAWRNISRHRQGSVTGGLTYDHLADLAYNPMKYTVLSPSKDLTKPILMGQGGGTRPRIGAFTLDMIDWNSNLAQLTGQTIGQEPPLLGSGSQAAADGNLPAVIADPMQFLSSKDIDVFRNAPSRLFDYAFSPLHLAMKAAGIETPSGEEPDRRYDFQKQGSYWGWLRESTDEERRQMARYQADRTLDPVRNAYLRDMLYEQFNTDFRTLDGMSSGNVAIDYRAIKLGSSIALLKEHGYDFESARGPATLLSSPVGGLQQIPVIGTQIMELVDPLTDEDRARWKSLSNDERMAIIGNTMLLQAGADFASSLPLFSGLGSVITIARGGGFGLAGQKAAGLYTSTLKVTNGLMATGLTIATVNWAASAVSPVYSESLGKEIDASRVVSGSALAGVVNTTGFFTGFYGIETAIPSWYRALRGDSLASQTLRWAGLKAAGAPKVDMKPADLSFHRELGGSRLGRILESDYGIDQQFQGTALSTEFLTTAVNAEARDIIDAFPAIARGQATGIPELDEVADLAERLARAEGMLAMSVGHAHAHMALVAKEVNFRLLEAPLNAGSRIRKAIDFKRRAARQLDDKVTQAMLGRYGERFFPSRLATAGDQIGLHDMARRYLRGLGKDQDLAGLTRFAGKDITKWKQVNRRLHQLLFFQRNAELYAASEGSHEAGRLGVVSQRHLFADEIEDLANALTDPDPLAGQQVMRALIATKDDVQELDAMGVFRTPEELAARLIQIAPTLPHRRSVGPSSAAGMLNDLQRVMDAEGLWTLAFKPTGRWSLPEGWVAADVPPPPNTTRLAYTPAQLRDMGYRPFGRGEVMRGIVFAQREPIWPVAEMGGGVWIREIPGEATFTSTAATANTGYSEKEIFLGDPNTWSTDPDWLFDSPQHEWDLSPALDAAGDEVWLHGGNTISANPKQGAWWPVLVDADGHRWIFKADWKKGTPDPDPAVNLPWGDLNPARRLSAPAVGKLLQYLEVDTAQEYPFIWKGVKGTLQPFYDGATEAPLGLDDLRAYVDPASPRYDPEAVNVMQIHQVIDWLVSQHDTNNGSFLTINGRTFGIDKGQAWAYFGKPDEVAAFNDPTGASFWGWRSPMAAEPHLGEFLMDWIKADGIVLGRQVVEDVLLKIEAIPEDVFRAWLRPLAEARVALGRFESTVDEFLDAMVARRDGLRAAVNRGYEHIGGYSIAKPGEPQVFKAGAMGQYVVPGSPIAVNGPRIVSGWDKFDEPDLPPAPRYKAGAVIEEADGRVWVIDVKDQYAGHLASFPKGGVDPKADVLNFPPGQAPDEQSLLRKAATREVDEETGFSITLTGFVTDIENPVTGAVTRYYRAVRSGGGPASASLKETESIVLLTPEQARARLVSHDPNTGGWQPDPEQQEVLEAWLGIHTQPADPLATPASAAPDPMASDPTIPGDGGLEAGEHFLSYTKFENGTVFRSPWLDYPMSMPEHVQMGNRAIHMQAFDDVFRGWRTYRLAENQRASLHRRLTNLDIGLTPAKIDRLHATILDLASEYKVPPQAFTLARAWIPFASKAYHELDQAIEKIVGPGPYLRSDGSVAKIDWRRELGKSYQTSLKLNLTAGLTSRFYTMGELGAGASFTSHVIYPALRFSLSPIFKAGEHVESWVLNLLRGINPRGGDPATEALMFEAGIGHSRSALRQELSSEPMLQGLTAAYTFVEDAATTRGMFLWTTTPAGITSGARRRMTAPPAAERSLAEQLFERPVDEDIYPTLLNDLGVDVAVRHPTTDPDTGTPILQFDNSDIDDLVIGQRFAEWMSDYTQKALMADVSLGLHQFGAGIAFVDSLGEGFVDTLARAVTPVHTRNSRMGSGLAAVRRDLENGFKPMAGPAGHDTSQVRGDALEGEAAAAQLTSPTGNTSARERIYGHIDAPYAGFGTWQPTGHSIMFVTRETAWKKALITTGDRMGVIQSGPSSWQENLLSPSGAFRALRQAIYKDLHAYGAGTSLLDDVNDLASGGFPSFGSMRPVEVAYPGGLGWDDIEAIVLDPDDLGEWADIVATYGGDYPELAGIKVLTLEPSTGAFSNNPWYDSNVDKTLMAYWLEKAGLADRRFIGDPARFTAAPLGAYDQFIPDELVTPQTASRIITNLLSSDMLGSVGVGRPKGRPRFQVVSNLEDDIRRSVAALDSNLRGSKANLEDAITTQSGRDIPDLQGRVNDLVAYREDALKLLDEVKEWRTSEVGGAFDDLLAAREALGGPEDAAAQAWIAGWTDLRTRYLGSQLWRRIDYWSSRGSSDAGFSVTRITPLDRFEDPDIDEVLMSRRASSVYDFEAEDIAADLPAVMEPGPEVVSAAGEADQVVAYARYLLDRYKEARHEGYQAGPATNSWRAIQWPDARDASTFAERMIDDLPKALQDRARAKLGRDPGRPIINVWFRGDRQAALHDRAGGEIVVTVTSGNGQPYGDLGLDEIAETWRATSLPKTQADMLAAGDQDHQVLAALGQTLWLPEGGPHGSVVSYVSTHNLPPPQRNVVTAADGTYYMTDASLAPERLMPVRFAYRFEPAGHPDFVNLTTLDPHGYSPAGWTAIAKVRVDPSTSMLTGTMNARQVMHDRSLVTAAAGSKADWIYTYHQDGDVTILELAKKVTDDKDWADRMVDDWLTRFENRTNGVRIDIASDNDVVMAVLKQRYIRGDIPDHWVIRKVGEGWDSAYDAAPTPAPRHPDDVPELEINVSARRQAEEELLALDPDFESERFMAINDFLKGQYAGGASVGQMRDLLWAVDEVAGTSMARTSGTLWRGVRDRGWAVGDYFDDPGFIFTTIDATRAQDYAWAHAGKATAANTGVAALAGGVGPGTPGKPMLVRFEITPGVRLAKDGPDDFILDRRQGWIVTSREMEQVDGIIGQVEVLTLRIDSAPELPKSLRYEAVMDADQWRREFGVPEPVIDLTAAPPPGGLEDVVGGPEHLTEALITRWKKAIAESTGATHSRLREGFRAFWDPVPGKQLQQDRLIQDIVRDWYPEMLAEYIPDMYDFMHTTVGVPDHEMVPYLIQDRKLLNRWLETGSREDFDRLVMHAERYGGGAGTREELDTLYAQPAWTDMMQVLQMTMKTASDEAFGVHFFNPYRSSFERSINHPLLGVYPASWAYKVAKEWARFLFDNDMFGGFRLGMAPAQYIANLQQQQAVAFAQMTGGDLEKWYQDGPLGSTIFVFNLLMPGDWSALPFPLSRSIRDALRGELDPTIHFRNNLFAMGLGRDIRLTTELGGEWANLANPDEPPFERGEAPWGERR